MIAKISRGWNVGGLVRYLMGPGRFHEHTGQRVVASWDGALEDHQPQRSPSAACGFDVTDLVQDLVNPAVLGGVSLREPDHELNNGPEALPGWGPERRPRRGPGLPSPCGSRWA